MYFSGPGLIHFVLASPSEMCLLLVGVARRGADACVCGWDFSGWMVDIFEKELLRVLDFMFCSRISLGEHGETWRKFLRSLTLLRVFFLITGVIAGSPEPVKLK